MNEKTLEEQLEEELKDQLTDISMLHTGTPEKSKAISDFAVLYDKRQDTIKLKAEAEEARVKKKDRGSYHQWCWNGVAGSGYRYYVCSRYEFRENWYIDLDVLPQSCRKNESHEVIESKEESLRNQRLFFFFLHLYRNYDRLGLSTN